MRLKRLVLENFQGIKHFEIIPDGKNTNIYGDNGTGKTTIANAISWLLFGKASSDIKNYTPKTKDKDGQDIHYLNHSAEAVFALDNGDSVTLKKVFYEDWKKKRGSNVEEFAGHITDHYIDGVPVKEKEYKERIEELCPPDKVRILTTPDYFSAGLHWAERRQILLDVCGSVTDKQVIDSTPELSELWDYLKKDSGGWHTIDAYMSIAASKKAEINRELTQIPARIDEATKAIPEVTEADKQMLDKVSEFVIEKSKLEQQKLELLNGTGLSIMRQELAELQAQLAEARAEHIKQISANTPVDNTPAMRQELANLEISLRIANANLKDAESKLAITKNKREILAAEYKDWQGRQWTGSDICAACEQPLPADKLEETKAKYNKLKSDNMERIRAQIEAECSKAIIAEIEAQIEKINAEAKELSGKIETLKAKIEQEKQSISEPPAFETTEEYKQLSAKIAKQREAIAKGEAHTAEKASELQKQIDEIQEQIQLCADIQAKINSIEPQKKRVEELKAQEKQLAAEYERLEKGIYLCELFIKRKVEMLDSSINGKFENVKFRLFQQQINGGIKEDCEVLIPTKEGALVPYNGSANTGAKVNAALEIIDTLGKYWGFTLPIIFDNAESVTRPRKTDAQQIRLIVSEKDKKLRVEIKED